MKHKRTIARRDLGKIYPHCIRSLHYPYWSEYYPYDKKHNINKLLNKAYKRGKKNSGKFRIVNKSANYGYRNRVCIDQIVKIPK